jgi:Ca2+:H+ antiporter
MLDKLKFPRPPITESFVTRQKRRIGPLVLLLAFVPVALALRLLGAPPVWVFAASALAIVPLAAQMGHATGRIAARTGPGLGGLLNATFGNAAELIIALVAMREGLYDVVKASITGSIIGNILLVLGLAILVGGVRHDRQTFNRTAASMGSTLLVLSSIGLLVPAIFHRIVGASAAARETRMSLEIAVVLFALYLASLLFTLKTHRHLYDASGEETPGGEAGGSLRRAIAVLAAATIGVAVMSEILVGAVQPTARAMGMTELFVGVVLVAIVGNAAEHSTALMMAFRNRMDVAVNIAVGSSTQIALFVAPVLVFASYAFGRPMDLVFTTFEVMAVTVAAAVATLVASDGESNWMEGALLLGVYAILALAFYFLP